MTHRTWLAVVVKWFSILWTLAAVAIVITSNVMIAKDWQSLAGIQPFNVRDSFAVALLLAPGAIAAGIDWLFFRRNAMGGRRQ
jgi:hypothetical protein